MLVTSWRFFCITSLMLVFCFARESQAQITGLGDLPGGDFWSLASSVSADGSVVVGVSVVGDNATEAFRWTSSGGLQGLGDLPGGSFRSSASGVSADGSVVVGTGSGASQFGSTTADAFIWTSIGGMQAVRDLFNEPNSRVSTSASGVSADGSVVVGATLSVTIDAYRWTIGERQDLGRLSGGGFSRAFGVSADGTVVVGTSGTSSRFLNAFRWTRSGGMEGLGSLPGGNPGSQAFGVSADGSVVVGSSGGTNGIEAFRWTRNGGMQGLGVLPGGVLPGGDMAAGDFPSVLSRANGVSADGLVVVGQGFGFRGDEAFIWQSGFRMRSLFDVLTTQGGDLSNWASLSEATAISADGRTIVGYGVNSSGNREAFVANINVLEPLLLGDINLNNQVDFLDIAPFISLLSSGDFQAEADVDQSGEVDFLDISPFIEILSGP